ncbi:MAG: hypothetical protein Q7J27_01310 [Syntrophales bacterium]|nr:hypothetical protein [Syntrophales bacterium]
MLQDRRPIPAGTLLVREALDLELNDSLVDASHDVFIPHWPFAYLHVGLIDVVQRVHAELLRRCSSWVEALLPDEECIARLVKRAVFADFFHRYANN